MRSAYQSGPPPETNTFFFFQGIQNTVFEHILKEFLSLKIIICGRKRKERAPWRDTTPMPALQKLQSAPRKPTAIQHAYCCPEQRLIKWRVWGHRDKVLESLSTTSPGGRYHRWPPVSSHFSALTISWALLPLQPKPNHSARTTSGFPQDAVTTSPLGALFELTPCAPALQLEEQESAWGFSCWKHDVQGCRASDANV